MNEKVLPHSSKIVNALLNMLRYLCPTGEDVALPVRASEQTRVLDRDHLAERSLLIVPHYATADALPY